MVWFSFLNSSWRAGSDCWVSTWSVHPLAGMCSSHNSTAGLPILQDVRTGVSFKIPFSLFYFLTLSIALGVLLCGSPTLPTLNHCAWALFGIPSCPRSCTRLVCQKPWTPLPKAFIPWFLIRGLLALEVVVTYCLPSSSHSFSFITTYQARWDYTPAGFASIMAVKTWLKVWCWLAATFCLYVWRLSICWHHCANVLPLLEVSPSLLPRCCADSPCLGHKSTWFSLPLVLLPPGRECVCPCPSRTEVAGAQSSLLHSCGSRTGRFLAFGGVRPVAISNQSEKPDFSSCCLLSPLNR